MNAKYRIADKTITISTLRPDVHELCAEYRAVGFSDFSAETTQADIDYEREKSAREDRAENLPVREYSDGYLEILAVYRKIAEKMPDYDTFLFHGSAVAVDGRAYVFTARSGTGKSTHARLWREMLGDRAVMVNDDKPLIKVNANGSAIVYGTPWDGKHHLSSNIAVPIQAICILERSETNQITEILKVEALPMLLQQAYRPRDPLALAKTLSLIDRLDVKLYRLGCNMNPDAAELSYRTMKQ